MVGFMASRKGRWMRILGGASLVLGGLASRSPQGRRVALGGLVPLVAAVMDICLLGPLFGLPLRGEAIRRQVGILGEDSLLPHPGPLEGEPPALLH
jgi:hypothetical protein